MRPDGSRLDCPLHQRIFESGTKVSCSKVFGMLSDFHLYLRYSPRLRGPSSKQMPFASALLESNTPTQYSTRHCTAGLRRCG